MNCESSHNTRTIYFSKGRKKQTTNGMPSSFNPILCCPLCRCLRDEIFCPAHGCIYSPLLGVWLCTQIRVRQEWVGIYSMLTAPWKLHAVTLFSLRNIWLLLTARYSHVRGVLLGVTNSKSTPPTSPIATYKSPAQANSVAGFMTEVLMCLLITPH